VLNDTELAAVWRVCDVRADAFGRATQLLMLSAQRRGEVTWMRRPDLDLAERRWIIPREFTKADRAHQVPLSPSAIAILEPLIKRDASEPGAPDNVLVFPATSRRKKSDPTPRPISGWAAFKSTLDAKVLEELRKAEAEKAAKVGRPVEAVKLPPWTLHDIRRSVASGMAALGVAPHVVERLLNHTGGTIRGVAAVYNRYGYESEVRHAVELWASHLEGLIRPAPANVVALRGGHA
jgi:integrase